MDLIRRVVNAGNWFLGAEADALRTPARLGDGSLESRNAGFRKAGRFLFGQTGGFGYEARNGYAAALRIEGLGDACGMRRMTGSGKTGLCIGLLEEAAIDAIPAIAIDPKGTSRICC